MHKSELPAPTPQDYVGTASARIDLKKLLNRAARRDVFFHAYDIIQGEERSGRVLFFEDQADLPVTAVAMPKPMSADEIAAELEHYSREARYLPNVSGNPYVNDGWEISAVKLGGQKVVVAWAARTTN